MKKIVATVLLLICSNTFMNAAWYGHLKSAVGDQRANGPPFEA
jgi:uncharacterized protein (DUF486 family)